MRKIVTIFGIFLSIICICTTANATETLDCSTNDFLIRMSINSFGQVSDMQLHTSTGKVFNFKSQEIELIKLVWEINGFGEKGNLIRLKTKRSESGFPSFRLEAEESSGRLYIDGKTSVFPCECDWGSK